MSENLIEIKMGDTFLDCGYRPIRCTAIDEDEGELYGVSMLDGTECSCSLMYCVTAKISEEEALIAVEAFQKDGERGLMRLRGWTEESIDNFMKEWR